MAKHLQEYLKNSVSMYPVSNATRLEEIDRLIEFAKAHNLEEDFQMQAEKYPEWIALAETKQPIYVVTNLNQVGCRIVPEPENPKPYIQLIRQICNEYIMIEFYMGNEDYKHLKI